MSVDDIRKAAWNLAGKSTTNGWLISERMPHSSEDPNQEKTGGTFSVGYKVEKEGKTAFMKVFDIVSAFDSGKPIDVEISRIAGEYNHEKALLDLCTSGRMSRVVRILDHGKIETPFPLPINPDYTLPLYFIIFERADGGDIRDVFNAYETVNDANRMEYLHHTIVGIQQLHQAQISHQDIKPSNVLIFKENGEGAKLADFGRALKKGAHAPHANFDVAGALYNAPPEQLYGYRAAEWQDRREASDLYNFGSLVSFVFSGQLATTCIISELPEEMWPQKWQGSYDDVLPMVQAAFAHFLVNIRQSFPEWARDRLEEVVKLCCEPDVHKRGDTRARSQVGRVPGASGPIGVDRFVTRMSVLRSEAQRRVITTQRGL